MRRRWPLLPGTPEAWACWSQRCHSLTVPRQPLSSSRCNKASFQVLVPGAERSDDLLNCLTRGQESGPRPSREMPTCYPVPPLQVSSAWLPTPTLDETAQAKGQSSPEALCEPCGRRSYVEQACPLHRFWKGPAGREEPRAWKLGAALVRRWRPCPQHVGAAPAGGRNGGCPGAVPPPRGGTRLLPGQGGTPRTWLPGAGETEP